MTGKYPSLMLGISLWWPGILETTDGFPILPSGVTATPVGAWNSLLDLGNKTIIKTFDGSTNCIGLTDSSAWNFGSNDFTICFWGRNLDDTKVQQVLSQYTVPADSAFTIHKYTDGNLYGYWNNGSTYDGDTIYVPWTGRDWHYFCIVRSGNSHQMFADMVGSSVHTITTNPPDINAPLYIGTNVHGAGVHRQDYYGQLKDIIVYNGRALTIPELKLIMNKTNPIGGTGMIPGPWDYYKVIA